MTSRYITLIISDIKLVSRVPVLLCAFLSPVIITLFLLYLFPVIFGFVRSADAFTYIKYYSVCAVTLISAIPFLYGLVFSYIHLTEFQSSFNKEDEKKGKFGRRNLHIRMVVSSLISIPLVLTAIYLTDAVSTEGWLRSIFASMLLSIMAPFIFLFVAGFSDGRNNRKLMPIISTIFLITAPAGLLLHHPWNYLAFFSPFYWISWAWVIRSPAESIIYGVISILISSACMFLCYRCLLKKCGAG